MFVGVQIIWKKVNNLIKLLRELNCFFKEIIVWGFEGISIFEFIS